ncbi:hypothetical protein TVAG_445430 [Trichomonas vaginalis G3]|uniref:FERM domain-containing protein n=1 Tax=Trichomonas vaginalis (strain ATCC PRA-98 / G3) TaxID=412133 RepID=A2E4K9_TRIV3|nr:KREV interaction trapped 1-related family [Trichomonas vaginalis G3]EAY12431.1 hypothetical protein TVAG_445430 [Trichomonas vaginalis G3]KAI5494196.1 KREV interaction trapped 1-related family [Trichomonas vaginalis G3]|eukprot:XP_001324654.1 hypothetical protein [Trichomonas vaginalis G3]
MPAEDVIRQAAINCNLPLNQSYQLFVNVAMGNQSYLLGGETLRMHGVQNGSEIIIMSCNSNVTAENMENLDFNNFQTGQINYSAVDYSINPNYTLNSTFLPPLQFDPGFAVDYNSQNFQTGADQFFYDDVNQFQTGIFYDPSLNTAPPVTDSGFFQFQSQNTLQNNQAGGSSVFNENMAFKVQPDDLLLNTSNGPQYAIEYDVAINNNLTDETNVFDFGVLKIGENDMYQQMENQGFQAYSTTVHDMTKEDGTTTEMKFFNSLDYNEVKTMVLAVLNLPSDVRYSLLFVSSAGERYWLKEGKSLERFQFTDSSNLFVYYRDLKVRIFTNHFDPRLCTIDAEEEVHKIVETLAENFGIVNYQCYTLYTLTDEGKEKALLQHQTVPEQTDQFTKLAYRREWFVFSRIDISNITAAVQTYKDAKSRLFRDKIPIPSKIELEFACLQFLVEADKQSRKNPKFPSDVDFFFPPDANNGKGLGQKLANYVRDYDQLDQFNALRRFFRLLKKLPGFGCTEFDCTVIARTRAGSYALDCKVEVGPHTVYIYDKLYPDTLEDLISFTKIIKIEFADDVLGIHFYARKLFVAQYDFQCERGKEIQALIDRHLEIMRDLMYSRAKNTALLPPVVNEKFKINLFTSADINKTKDLDSFIYDRNYTGMLLVAVAESHLKIKHNDNHIALMKMDEEIYRFIMKDEILVLCGAQEGMTIYILERFTNIEISFSDGTKKEIKLDITKNIEQLTKDCFASIDFPPLTGFTFWTTDEDGQLKPLDVRFTIPEQTPFYSKLTLKRRFYTLSAEILQTVDVARMTMLDTVPCLKEHQVQGTDDEFNELYALWGYAMVVSNFEESEHMNDYSWLEQIFPKDLELNDSFKKSFGKFFKNFPPKEKFIAMKTYLGKIRKLVGFGYEYFDCQFQDLTPGHPNKVHKNYKFTLAPLMFAVGPSTDMARFQVGYRYIITFETTNEFLVIKFVQDEQGSAATIKMLFKNTINEVVMILAYNIKLINDLILARELRKKKQMEEQIKRLRGGYVDEKGRIYGAMIDFYITKDPQYVNPRDIYWIEINLTGAQVVVACSNTFKLDLKDTEFCILYKSPENIYQWVAANQKIATLNPPRLSTLIILEHYPTINVIPIGAMNPAPQQIRIDASRSLNDLMPEICLKFDLPYIPGVTLAYLQDKKIIYLDTARSVPEQADLKKDFYIMLRHFAINPDDITDPMMLWFLFCQTRECVLRGTYPLEAKDVSTLCYFQINALTGNLPTKDMIPSNDSEWVPKGMKKPNVGNLFSELAQINGPMDQQNAMRKYINYARNCKGFSCHIFKVEVDNLMDFKKRKIFNTISIGPQEITIYDEKQNNILGRLLYSNILTTESKMDEASIKYRCLPGGEVQYYNWLHQEAISIYYLVNELCQIHKQCLTNHGTRIRGDGSYVQPENCVNLLTIMGLDDPRHGINLTYSIYYTVQEVINMACQALMLLDGAEYLGLIRMANGEFRWMNPNDLLGHYYPQAGYELFIFNKFTRVPIILEKTYSDSVMIEIDKPLFNAIPDIAAYFYVEFFNGFTLFKDWTKDEPTRDTPKEYIKGFQPLDLTRSIPEQLGDVTPLIFKRRFYNFTNEDMRSIDRRAFLEVRKHILNSDVVCPEPKGIELAVYSIFADATSPDVAKHTKVKEARKILPACIPGSQKIGDVIEHTIKSSPDVNPPPAMRKYVAIARTLLFFGCSKFLVYQQDEKGSKYQVLLSVGPFGIHILRPKDNCDIAKISWQNVINSTTIAVKVDVKVVRSDGQNDDLMFWTEQAIEINSIINQYLIAMNPWLNGREQVQSLSEDPAIGSLKNSIKTFSIPLRCSSYVRNPAARPFGFNPNWNANEAVRMALYNLGIKNDRQHVMLYLDSNHNFKWLESGKQLATLNPTKLASIYAIPAEINAIVVPPMGPIERVWVKTRTMIRDNVGLVNNHFKLGYPFGCTFYEFSGDDILPLDFLNPLPTETPHYTAFATRRRFFIVTKDMMTSDETISSLFRDFNEQVLYKKNSIPNAAAIELGICQLYAECSDAQQTANLGATINPDSYRRVVPESLEKTEQMYEQFINAFCQHHVMTSQEAVYRYICIASVIPDIGAEMYVAEYKNNQNPVQNETEVNVILSANGVFIRDKLDFTIIKQINYKDIISYKLTPGVCNVKFQDENFLYQDYNFQTQTRAAQINSYINDIIDIYKTMAAFGQERLIDESIPYEQYGLNINRRQNDGDDKGIEDVYDEIVNFDEIRKIDFDFDRDTLADRNFDDTYKIPQSDCDFRKFKDFNQEEAKDNFNEQDIMWRADNEALTATRRHGGLSELQVNLQDLAENTDQLDMTDMAARFAKLKNNVDDLDLGDHSYATDLRSAFDSLANTSRNAALSTVKFDEVSPQFDTHIGKAETALKTGLDMNQSIISKLKTEAKKSPPANPDPTDILLAETLVNMSEIEEQIAKQFADSEELISKLGADPDKLRFNILENSAKLTDLANQLKNNKGNKSAIVSLIPKLRDTMDQLDAIKKMNEVAAASGITVGNTEKLHSTLDQLASNAEKIALASKMQDEMKNPEFAKQRQYQLYLGNHEPVKAALKALSELLPLTSQCQNMKGIPQNERESLDRYLGVVKPTLTDLCDDLKREISMLNQCPTNEAVRAAMLNDMYSAIAECKECEKNLYPYEGRSKEAKSALDQIRRIQPGCEEALRVLSTANINGTSIDELLNAMNDYQQTVEKTPKNVLAQAPQSTVQAVNKDITSMKALAPQLKRIGDQLKKDPTNGELMVQAQQQLLQMLKDEPIIYADGLSLVASTKSKPLSSSVNNLHNAMPKVLTENRSMEEPDVARHIAMYQQSMAELDRLTNLIDYTVDKTPALSQDNKLKKQIQEIKSKILDNRPNLGRCRNELHAHPYSPPTHNAAYDNLENSLTPVEDLCNIVDKIKEKAPNSPVVAHSALTDQIIKATLEALKNANLGEFRKPPNKEAVVDIQKNIQDMADMLKHLLTSKEVTSKPKVEEALKKKLEELLVAQEKLNTQVGDPTVEYIPMAEDLIQTVQETKNICNGLQAFKQDPKGTALVDQTQSNLAYSLQKTPPNIDLANRCILENIKPLQDLAAVAQYLSARPSVQNDPAATKVLKDWNENINKALYGIDKLAHNPNPTLMDLNDVKNILAQVHQDMGQIPIELKPHLTNKDFSELGKAICAVKNHSGIAANCVRLLPVSEKFEFDSSPFVLIDPTSDTLEALKKVAEMVNAYNNILNRIEGRSDFMSSKECATNVTELKKMLSVPLKPLTNYKDEQSAIKTLLDLRALNPDVMNDANTLSGYLNSEQFREISKIMTDSFTRAYAMMTRPHVTKANSDAVTSLLVDLMKKAQPLVDSSLNNKTLQSDKKLYSKLQAYDKLLPNLIDNLKKMTIKQQQEAVDDLHQKTAKLLKMLEDKPDCIGLIDKLEPIYTATKKYTTGERVPVKVAGLLIPRRSKKDEEKNKDAFKAAYTSIDASKAKPSDIKTITEGLNAIKNAKTGVPQHLIRSATAILPLVEKGDPVNCSDAARVLATASSDPATRTKQMTDLAFKDVLKASLNMGDVQDAIKALEDIINRNAGDLPEDFMEYYSDALKNMRLLNDPKVLEVLNTLSASIKEYQPLHAVDDAVRGMINNAKDIKGMKKPMQDLQTALAKATPWLNQADLAMAGLVELQADSIAKNAEDIIHADELGKLPEETADLVNNMVLLLKDKDRNTAFNKLNAQGLAKLLNEFQQQHLPKINKNTPDTTQKTAINDSVNSLNNLNPVMRLWTNKLDKNEPELIRKDAESELLKAMEDLLLAANTNTPLQQQKMNLASTDGRLQALSQKLQEYSAANKPVQKVISDIGKAHSNIVKQKKSKKPDITDSKGNIEEALKDLKDVDPSIVSKDDRFKIDTKGLDKDALTTAKAAKKMAKALDAELEDDMDINDSDFDSEDLGKGGKKRRRRRLRKRKHRGRLRGALKDEIKAQNDIDDKKLAALVKLQEDRPFPTDIKEALDALDKLIDENAPIVPPIPNEVFNAPTFTQQMFKELLGGQEKYNLVDRLTSLQKEQRTLFADVKKLDDPEIKDLKDYNSNDIQDAIISLQRQLDNMNDPNKLLETQQHIDANQFKLQQKILSHAADLTMQPDSRLPLSQTIDFMRNAEDDLLENLIINHGNDPAKVEIVQAPSLQRTINRGVSLSDMIDKLSTLATQLLQNNPDVFKYAKTKEGMKVMNHPLSSHDIMETQKEITSQLSQLNSPEILAVRHKAMPPEGVIQEIRILEHLLDLLTGANGDAIIGNEDIEPTEDAIFDKINSDQIRIASEDPSKLKLPSLVNTHKALKAEHYLLDTIARLDLAQRLGQLQQQQCAISEVPKGAMNPDEASLQPAAAVHRELPSILEQVDSLDNPKQLVDIIKKLSPGSISAQQQILLQLASILTQPKVLGKFPESSKITKVAGKKVMNKLQESIMKRTADMLCNEPDKIADVDIEQSTSPNDSLQAFDYASQVSQQAGNLASLLSQIHQNSMNAAKTGNEAKNNVHKGMEGKKFEQVKEPFEELKHLQNTSPEEIKDYVTELDPKEQSIAYLLAADRLKALQETPHGDLKVSDLSMASKVFDHAALIQRNKAETDKLPAPNLANVNSRIEDSKAELAKRNVADMLSALQLQRIANAPNLVDAAHLDEKLLSNITADSIGQAVEAAQAQVKLLGNADKLKASILANTPEQLAVQQALLTDSMKLTMNDDFMNPILAQIDFKKENPTSPQVANKILKEILDKQAQALKGDPIAVSRVTLDTPGQLAEIHADTLEQKERAKLNNQFLTAIDALSSLSPEGVKLAKASSGGLAKDLEPADLASLQELIKSIIVEPTKTKSKIKETSANEIATLLSLLDDMSKTVQPLTTAERQKVNELSKIGLDPNNLPQIAAVSADTATPKKEGKKLSAKKSTAKKDVDLIQQQKKGARPISIFNTPIKIDEASMRGKATDSRKPSLADALDALVRAANGVVDMLPTMSSVPLKEAKETLLKDTQLALDILDDILKRKDRNYNPQVGILTEMAPELIAAMSRVIPTLDKSLKDSLPDDPSTVLPTISSIQKNAINLDNNKAYEDYKKSASNLQEMLKKVNAAIGNINADPTVCVANIVSQAKKIDLPTLNKELMDFQAAKVNALKSGQNKKQIGSFDPIISQIVPQVRTAIAKPPGSKEKQSDSQGLDDLLKRLQKALDKEVFDPFASIEALARPSDIPAFIGTVKPKIETTSNALIKSVSTQERTGAEKSVEDLIRHTTDAQAAMLKGIDLKPTNSVPELVNFFNGVNTSMKSLDSILNQTKNAAATPVALRRCQRTIERVVDQLNDQIQILDRTAKPSKVDEKKIEFIKAAAAGLQPLVTTVSARASAPVKEIFSSKLQANLPQIKTKLDAVKKAGTAIAKVVADKQSLDMHKQVGDLLKALNEFMDDVQDPDKTSLLDAAGNLVKVSGKVAETVGFVAQLTDKNDASPDVANSSRLPSRFVLPILPNDVKVNSRSDLYNEINALTTEYNKLENKFLEVSLAEKTSNGELADRMIELYEKMKVLALRHLLMSTSTNNLDNQDQMAKELNNAAVNFNKQLRTLRGRFLLSVKSWDMRAPLMVNAVTDSTKLLLQISKKIADEETANEEFKKALGFQFTQALGPLSQAQTAINSDSSICKALPKGEKKEWATAMVDIGKNLGDAVQKVFNYLKDHPSKKIKPEAVSAFASNLTTKLNGIDMHAKEVFAGRGNPAAHCCEAIKDLSSLGQAFSDSVTGIDIPGLKDAVISICKASDKTFANAEAAMKRAGATEATIEMEGTYLGEEDLMKRLILEAKVVKARLFLGRYENKLKALN